MSVRVLGISHRTAPVAIREQLARLPHSNDVNDAKPLLPLPEWLSLHTCNRSEWYWADATPAEMMGYLSKILPEWQGLQPYFYCHENEAAVKHIMQVASGIDSMVLGEVEILGQLKTAYNHAKAKNQIGKILGRLFQHTFTLAKQVRSQTTIGLNPVSVAYAAARLSQQIFSELTETRVLLLGAGDMIRKTAEHLTALGAKNLMVANRTFKKAQELAMILGGEALTLDALPRVLKEADIVIASSASPTIWITKTMVAEALIARKQQPMFLVDLAVPRDIADDVAELEGAYLYNIDDLSRLVEENRQNRLKAVDEATLFIELETEKFMGWLRAQRSVTTIRAFREKCEETRDTVLQEALRHLNQGKAPAWVLERMAHNLTNRLMHEPTKGIRQASFNGEDTLIGMVQRLFNLNHFNS